MSSNQDVANAIVEHHRALEQGLTQHVEKLLDAVRAGHATARPQRELLEFLTGDLLPHAVAEEDALYVVGDDSSAALLVQAMVAEHRAITRHVEGLGAADTPLAAACAASAIRALVEIHLEKENERLLPFLVADEQVSLADRLAGMHQILGGPSDVASSAEGEVVVDVRPEPPARRHPMILSAFEELTPGAGFVLVNDHDPKPLYYQFAAEHAGEFGWEYLEQGPETWRVHISRVQSAAGA